MPVHVYIYAHICSRGAPPDKSALLTMGAFAHSSAAPGEAKPFASFSGLLVMPAFAPPAMLSRDWAMQCLQFKSREVKIMQSDWKSEHDCDGSKDEGKKKCRTQTKPIQNCYTSGKAGFPSTVFSHEKFLRNEKQTNKLKNKMQLHTSFFFVIFPNQQWTDVTNEKLGL